MIATRVGPGSGLRQIVVGRWLLQQFRMGGESFEHSENGAGGKTGAAQPAVCGAQLPFIANMTPGHDGGHAPFDVGRDHLVFIFILKRLRDRFFGEFGRHAAGPQVMQNTGFSEAVIFDAHGRVHFGESLVVEITELLKPRDQGFDIGQFRRPPAKFEAQFVG